MDEDDCRVIQTLANPIRAKLIAFMAKRAIRVNEAAEHLGLDYPNTRTHLTWLINAGVVQSMRDGMPVYYWVKRERFIDGLNAVGKALGYRVELDPDFVQDVPAPTAAPAIAPRAELRKALVAHQRAERKAEKAAKAKPTKKKGKA